MHMRKLIRWQKILLICGLVLVVTSLAVEMAVVALTPKEGTEISNVDDSSSEEFNYRSVSFTAEELHLLYRAYALDEDLLPLAISFCNRNRDRDKQIPPNMDQAYFESRVIAFHDMGNDEYTIKEVSYRFYLDPWETYYDVGDEIIWVVDQTVTVSKQGTGKEYFFDLDLQNQKSSFEKSSEYHVYELGNGYMLETDWYVPMFIVQAPDGGFSERKEDPRCKYYLSTEDSMYYGRYYMEPLWLMDAEMIPFDEYLQQMDAEDDGSFSQFMEQNAQEIMRIRVHNVLVKAKPILGVLLLINHIVAIIVLQVNITKEKRKNIEKAAEQDHPGV